MSDARAVGLPRRRDGSALVTVVSTSPLIALLGWILTKAMNIRRYVALQCDTTGHHAYEREMVGVRTGEALGATNAAVAGIGPKLRKLHSTTNCSTISIIIEGSVFVLASRVADPPCGLHTVRLALE